MDWPTWQQGTVTAVLFGSAALVLRPGLLGRGALRRGTPRADVPRRAQVVAGAASVEIALLAVLYAIWRVARELPLATTGGAIERARQIDRLQHTLHLPSELSLQHFVLDHQWLGRFLNYYYAILHVPALIVFLVWLFVRHRDHFPHWRNGLAILTGFCLVIRFVRVAPPRFLPDLGYIDLATRFGMSVYGPAGTGVSDQLAAMPSIHVGWAAVVSFGIVAATTSRWRWLALAHVVLTSLAVSATGNHWWMDGIVAIALLGVALQLDTAGRRFVAGVRARRVALAMTDGKPMQEVTELDPALQRVAGP